MVTIGKKLVLSFAGTSLISAVLGISAWFGMARMTSGLDNLVHVTEKKAALTSDLKYSVLTMRFGERGILLFASINGEQKKIASKTLYDGAVARVGDDIRELRPLLQTDQERELLNTAENAVKSYAELRLEVDRLVAADKVRDAMQLDMDKVVGFGAIATNAFNKLGEQQQAYFDQAVQQANTTARTSRIAVVTCLALSIALGVILSIVISRGVSIPLGKALAVLEQVAAGDLTVSLDVRSEDEVGRMATALNDALAKLRSTLQAVAESAANANSSSHQLASAAESIASGSQEQAASLEETAASLEEITATVRQSADNAQQASQLAVGSRDSAESGQEVVSHAVTAMADINESSAKIFDIISTIDEIAFQTNLLAVNAAVEAARAGEEGRGFAVVASEVRSLAQRSAGAAKEIKVLIQDSLRKVEKGTELVNRSGETLQGIVTSVKRVTDIVAEIALAAGEQSTGIVQVNTAMTQMDQVTQANSAQTEELSGTAQSLSEDAARLLELVSAFKLGDSRAGSEVQSHPHKGVAPSTLEVRPPEWQAAKTTSSFRNQSGGGNTRKSNAFAVTARSGQSVNKNSRSDRQAVMDVPASRAIDDSSFEEF